MKTQKITEIGGLITQLLPLVAQGVIGAYNEVQSLVDAIKPEGDVSAEDEAAARERGEQQLAKLNERAEQARQFIASRDGN
jgi:ElaB/YqjD/DUF883 family membrane-anchored ribosome-binding protein